MADTSLLSDITFARPSRQLAATGLIAWVGCDHAAIRLHGIELRRTVQGELTVSFAPARFIGDRLCTWAKPISNPARRAMEREIIAAAAREGWL